MARDKVTRPTLSQDTLNALSQLKKKTAEIPVEEKIRKVIRETRRLHKGLMVLMNKDQRRRLGRWECGGYIINPYSNNPRIILSVSEANYAHQMIVYYLSRSNYINIENVNKLNYDLPDSIKVRFDMGDTRGFGVGGDKLDEWLSNLMTEHLRKVNELLETAPISLQGCNIYDSDSETIKIFPDGFDDVDFNSPYQGNWLDEDVDIILPEDSIFHQDDVIEFIKNNDIYECRDYIEEKIGGAWSWFGA